MSSDLSGGVFLDSSPQTVLLPNSTDDNSGEQNVMKRNIVDDGGALVEAIPQIRPSELKLIGRCVSFTTPSLVRNNYYDVRQNDMNTTYDELLSKYQSVIISRIQQSEKKKYRKKGGDLYFPVPFLPLSKPLQDIINGLIISETARRRRFIDASKDTGIERHNRNATSHKHEPFHDTESKIDTTMSGASSFPFPFPPTFFSSEAPDAILSNIGYDNVISDRTNKRPKDEPSSSRNISSPTTPTPSSSFFYYQYFLYHSCYNVLLEETVRRLLTVKEKMPRKVFTCSSQFVSDHRQGSKEGVSTAQIACTIDKRDSDDTMPITTAYEKYLCSSDISSGSESGTSDEEGPHQSKEAVISIKSQINSTATRNDNASISYQNSHSSTTQHLYYEGMLSMINYDTVTLIDTIQFTDDEHTMWKRIVKTAKDTILQLGTEKISAPTDDKTGDNIEKAQNLSRARHINEEVDDHVSHGSFEQRQREGPLNTIRNKVREVMQRYYGERNAGRVTEKVNLDPFASNSASHLSLSDGGVSAAATRVAAQVVCNAALRVLEGPTMATDSVDEYRSFYDSVSGSGSSATCNDDRNVKKLSSWRKRVELWRTKETTERLLKTSRNHNMRKTTADGKVDNSHERSIKVLIRLLSSFTTVISTPENEIRSESEMDFGDPIAFTLKSLILPSSVLDRRFGNMGPSYYDDMNKTRMKYEELERCGISYGSPLLDTLTSEYLDGWATLKKGSKSTTVSNTSLTKLRGSNIIGKLSKSKNKNLFSTKAAENSKVHQSIKTADTTLNQKRRFMFPPNLPSTLSVSLFTLPQHPRQKYMTFNRKKISTLAFAEDHPIAGTLVGGVGSMTTVSPSGVNGGTFLSELCSGLLNGAANVKGNIGGDGSVHDYMYSDSNSDRGSRILLLSMMKSVLLNVLNKWQITSNKTDRNDCYTISSNHQNCENSAMEADLMDLIINTLSDINNEIKLIRVSCQKSRNIQTQPLPLLCAPRSERSWPFLSLSSVFICDSQRIYYGADNITDVALSEFIMRVIVMDSVAESTVNGDEETNFIPNTPDSSKICETHRQQLIPHPYRFEDLERLRMFTRRYIVHTSQGNNPHRVSLISYISQRVPIVHGRYYNSTATSGIASNINRQQSDSVGDQVIFKEITNALQNTEECAPDTIDIGGLLGTMNTSVGSSPATSVPPPLQRLVQEVFDVEVKTMTVIDKTLMSSAKRYNDRNRENIGDLSNAHRNSNITHGRSVLLSTSIPSATTFIAVVHLLVSIGLLLYSSTVFSSLERNILNAFSTALSSRMLLMSGMYIVLGAVTGFHGIKMELPLQKKYVVCRAVILFLAISVSAFSTVSLFILVFGEEPSIILPFKSIYKSQGPEVATLEHYWIHLVSASKINICHYQSVFKCTGYKHSCDEFSLLPECSRACTSLYDLYPDTRCQTVLKEDIYRSFSILIIVSTACWIVQIVDLVLLLRLIVISFTLPNFDAVDTQNHLGDDVMIV